MINLEKLPDDVVNCFKSNLTMYINNDFCNKNFIMVEGKMDYRFYKKIFANSNNVIKSIDYIIAREYLRGTQDRFGNKKIIKLLLKKTFDDGLNNLIESNNVYGIVDKDFDDEYPTVANNRIFSNDTTDLETMLLSSDGNLLNLIKSDTFYNSCIMAYQLSCLKKAVEKSKDYVNMQKISFYEYNKFFDGQILNIKKAVNFLIARSSGNNKSKNGKILSSVLDSLEKEKLLDNNHNIRLNIAKFENKLPQNFWQDVNGHYLLQSILYLDKSKNYLNEENKFEEYLVDNYSTCQFENTKLYEKLNSYKIQTS